MSELKNYIIKHISILFFSIYMPIFVIASLMMLVQLASLTAYIHLTIWDMTQLYLFSLPMTIFYTISIAFFIAAVMALFRLSNDNEIIVIFSLGISPKFLLKTLLTPALLLALVEFFNLIVVFPKTSILYRNFKAFKQSEAKFNMSAGEFGHSFGDWLLYIGKKNKDNDYADVFLFNKKQKEETLIYAKHAQILNKNSILTLHLEQGDGYSYSTKKFSQTHFDAMAIHARLNTGLTKNESILEYWTSNYHRGNKDRKLILGTMFALFPLVSLFLILSLGVVHARHQKSSIYLYIFLSLILYFVPTIFLQKKLLFWTIPTVLIPWIIGTYWIYRKKIAARF